MLLKIMIEGQNTPETTTNARCLENWAQNPVSIFNEIGDSKNVLIAGIHLIDKMQKCSVLNIHKS